MAIDQRTRLAIIEERRKAGEGALWQLPSVSIAAQAFLLGAALDSKASRGTEVAAGALGMLVVIATGAVVAFMGAQMKVLGLVIEQESEQTLDARELSRTVRLNWGQRALLRLPTPFWFWSFTLVGFVVIDVLVLTGSL